MGQAHSFPSYAIQGVEVLQKTKGREAEQVRPPTGGSVKP